MLLFSFLRLGVMVVLGVLCTIQDTSGAEVDTPPFDVEQWLSTPDHDNFKWSIAITEPQLNLQLRYVVKISATIECSKLPVSKTQRDLHFVVKVAGPDNAWIPGYSYTRVSIPPGLDGSYQVEYFSGLYLRSGNYTVALLVYDPVIDNGNILRTQIEVPHLASDLLPEFDRDLRDIEFIDLLPPKSVGNVSRIINNDWPFSKGREWLPVNNSRPLCVDIVTIIPSGEQDNPAYGISGLMKASSVLSHLRLRDGNIRVSILDVFRMKEFYDREDATNFDWQYAHEVLLKQDFLSIEANVLASRTQASDYLFGKLKSIMEDSSCTAKGKSPLKIVILVSNQIRFAEHTDIRQVVPGDPDSVRFIYFRNVRFVSADDLLKMLKPAKHETYELRQFPARLAELTTYLEKLK